MPNSRPLAHVPQAARRRPQPLDADGALGRALVARYDAAAEAPLPERLTELLERLDLRAADKPPR